MTSNRQGLVRNIPSPVKRAVRKRCGFGCVVCGDAFYEYDHLEVEFKDAVEHDPERIVLLCGGCHGKKTRGFLSTESIIAASKNPRCLQVGFTRGGMDVGGDAPEVVLGTITATNFSSLITIDGEDIFSIAPPEEAGGPFRINASLYDQSGAQILEIVENEIRVGIANWDAELVGQRITLRSGLGAFSLILRVEPPRRLVIERMHMNHRGLKVECIEGKPSILERNGWRVEAGGIDLDHVKRVIVMDGPTLSIGAEGGPLSSVKIKSITVNSGPAWPTNVPMSPTLPVGAWRQPRNELCRCGSGVKFKRCHGRL